MKRLWGCFIVLSIMITSPIFAETVYYVDGTHGNDQNDGLTLQTAWKTIGKANTTLQAGDTVYIRGGTYKKNNYNSCIRPSHSGSPGKYITYKNYNKEEVIITDVFLGVFIGSSTNYIKIDGVTIDGGNEQSPNMDIWVRIFGHHNFIQNCTMRYAACDDFFQGIRIEQGSHHNKILKNTLHHVGKPQPPAPDDTGNAVELSGDYNLVQDNNISYSGHDLIYSSGKNNVIRNNYLHNHWGRCLALDGTDQINKKNLVENNRICYATHRHNNVLPNDGMESFQAYAIIRNNEFYDNWGHGLQLISLSRAQPSYKKIYHNVFYHNGYHPSPKVVNIGYAIRITENEPSQQPFQGVVVKNNIFYDNVYSGISWGSGTSPSKHTVKNNFEAGDPLFVNKANHNFRLQAKSPCIDAGTWLTTTTSSGSGKQIPVKDASYFCDGFGVINGDIIQLEGQTETATVTKVDYANNILKIDKSLTWQSGQGVSLPYSGSHPDIGAYEYKESASPLRANIEASLLSGTIPLTVDFSGSASGGIPPYSYKWNFGDRESSNTQNPTHTYPQAGNYTVTLTVTDDQDNKNKESITIGVSEPLQSADFFCSPTTFALGPLHQALKPQINASVS